ncbi:MAG: type I-E CRISPR-associated protein Cas7/Cse4/CasC [Bacteroidota bacterium]
MARFIQLHLLTAYPPSNLNRDDLGRPKTAVIGGKTRLRVSSQSLKRHWRTSDLFRDAFRGQMGDRTKDLGPRVLKALTDEGMDVKDAETATQAIAKVFGKPKGKREHFAHETLVFYDPAEIDAIDALVARLAGEKRQPEAEELNLLSKTRAVDIGMFGRMLADPKAQPYKTDASIQVAHAFTVHEVQVEDDYYTAMDDASDDRIDFFAAADTLGRERTRDDAGAAHLDVAEFGAGVFYLYVCIDAASLVRNLGGDADLAREAARTLTEAAATVAPGGKQNSYASRAYASLVLAEAGDRQPRSLMSAFLRPVQGGDPMEDAIARLSDTRDKMDHAYYGDDRLASETMNVPAGDGTLAGVLEFIASHVPESTDG